MGKSVAPVCASGASGALHAEAAFRHGPSDCYAMGCAPRKDHVEDEDENSMSASRNCPPQQRDQCANDDSADYHTAGDLSAYCSSDDDDGSDTSRDNQAQDGHTPELSAAILQRVDTAKQMFRRQFTQLG